jgi:hypothetical protein
MKKADMNYSGTFAKVSYPEYQGAGITLWMLCKLTKLMKQPKDTKQQQRKKPMNDNDLVLEYLYTDRGGRNVYAIMGITSEGKKPIGQARFAFQDHHGKKVWLEFNQEKAT